MLCKIFAWQRKRPHLLAASAVRVPIQPWRCILVECGGGYPFKGLTSSHSLKREVGGGGKKKGWWLPWLDLMERCASEADVAHNCTIFQAVRNTCSQFTIEEIGSLISRHNIIPKKCFILSGHIKATALSLLGWSWQSSISPSKKCMQEQRAALANTCFCCPNTDPPFIIFCRLQLNWPGQSARLLVEARLQSKTGISSKQVEIRFQNYLWERKMGWKIADVRKNSCSDSWSGKGVRADWAAQNT